METSVIIPTYNYARFLTRALASVVGQDTVGEILVVDDGSNDDAATVVQQFQRDHGGMTPAIHYIWQANAGPSAARNHGAALARYEWLAFLDADDYWYAGKMRAQAALVERYPQGALFFAGVDCEDIDGRRVRHLPPRDGVISWNELLLENMVYSPTPLLRAEVFRSAGGFDENRRLSEDWDLWLRVAERAPVIAQRQALACYLDHSQGLHRDARITEAAWSVWAAAMARQRRSRLRPGMADEAIAALLSAEAYGQWSHGQPTEALRMGWRAARYDWSHLATLGKLTLKWAVRRWLTA